MLVSHQRCFRGLLGIARNFMDSSSHLVHGSRHLIGLDLLVIDPGAGLLGHRRQLFGGAGDLGDAITDAADQLAQAQGHALHAGLQLAQFVAARLVPGLAQVLAEVTVGHTFSGGQGLAQRDDNLPGNGPGREQSQRQCQRGGAGEHRLGLTRAGVANLGL
ncbi:hypothetical protein D3C79_623660 [compost metagenome]